MSKRDEIMALIRHHGLTVETVGQGTAVRVSGNGVHITAVSLDWIRAAGIAPVTHDNQVMAPHQVAAVRGRGLY